MDEAGIVPGSFNIRVLDATVAHRKLTITVHVGPQAARSDLTTADAIVTSIELVPPGPSILVATLDAPEDGTMPGLTFGYGGKHQEYFAQGGHWPGVNGFLSPLLTFSPALAPVTLVEIDGDASAVFATLEVLDQDLRRTEDVIPLELDAGTATLPDDAAFYGLTLRGTWPRGAAVFYVVIQAGEPVVIESPPLPVVKPGMVPDLVGIGEGDANKLLFNADLEGKRTYEPVPGVANGVVASIDPPAGTVLEAGSVVNLVVSGTTAFPEGTVSALVGLDEDRMPFLAMSGNSLDHRCTSVSTSRGFGTQTR